MKKYMTIVLIVTVALILIQAFRLLILRRQISAYKTYWQNLATEDVPKDAIWYVALGDSAAQGIGASRPEKGYVGQVAAEIAQKTGKPVHVINLSANGAKVADVIRDQIQKLNLLNLPDSSIVTVEVGANDMANFQPDRFEKEFDRMLGLLPSNALVSNVPYFGKGIFRSRERSVVKANQIIDRLIKARNMHIVPLYEVTKSNSSWLNNAADVFHPNDRGYKWWYEAFRQELN